MIFQFPVMQLPYLILADWSPCMRRISHSGEIRIMQIMIMHVLGPSSEIVQLATWTRAFQPASYLDVLHASR